MVLFFVDAFGWRFFAPRAESYPFLADIGRQGAVAQLTSQFPSTTAAHVTALPDAVADAGRELDLALRPETLARM